MLDLFSDLRQYERRKKFEEQRIMWIVKRIYCRTFQFVFKTALPFLPYRNPKIVPFVAGIADICRKKNINSVMIVTDAGIRSLGLTRFLEEEVLTKYGISYCVYDRTVANPTIWNVEEARELYLKIHGLCQSGRGQNRKTRTEHPPDEGALKGTQEAAASDCRSHHCRHRKRNHAGGSHYRQ